MANEVAAGNRETSWGGLNTKQPPEFGLSSNEIVFSKQNIIACVLQTSQNILQKGTM